MPSVAACRTGASTSRRLASAGFAALGVAGLAAVWWWWSASRPAVLAPSPAETLQALGRIAGSGELVAELGVTLERAAVGVVVGALVGAAWGLAAGLWWPVGELTRPARAAMLGIPPIVLVVVGMVWLGTGERVVWFVVIAVAVPVVAVNAAEGVRAVDPDLLEMAGAHGVGRARVVREIVVPAVAGPLVAALALVSASALRVTIMAELLAASDGIGSRIGMARVNLLTEVVFAWALVAVAATLAIDHLVIGPVRRRALRWREAPGRPGGRGLRARRRHRAGS